ncbi:MAG: choice-of-anchor J domain-containing protein [Muribaculaceae bacterium]|nr:choice-of-anchor J domain-containing protein [Muribaculaceae bacterium]
MNNFFKLTLTAAMGFSVALGASAQISSRAYGIQIYSEAEPEAPQKLVSFSVDNPKDVAVEADFSGYDIMAAACHNGTYYMLHSDDMLTPAKLVTYNMATHILTDVVTYGLNDLAARLIVFDMTYDPATECLYVVGADLADAEVVGGEIEAHFALFSIDPETGEAALIGYQEAAVIVSLAAGEDELWGIDQEGNVWTISKYTGHLEDIIDSTYIYPIGRQSMTYDFGNGVFYWASYTSDEFDAGKGVSNLLSLRINEDWEVEKNELGAIGDDVEVIGMYIDDNPIDRNAPAGVTSFTVTPADGGLGEALLSWTNPSEALNGTKLEGAVTVTVYRDGKEAGSVEGTPGEAMTWTDTNVASATYTYSVTVSSNGLTGPAVYALPLFIGTDIPGAPTSVTAARNGDGFDIAISWNAPASGANGGWFDTSDLHYCVTRFPDNKVVAADTQELSFVDSDITMQAGYSYGVKVLAGDVYGPEAISNIVVSGPALTVPYTMTLTPEDEALWSVFNSDGDEYQWYVFREMWGGTTDPFFRYYPETLLDPYGEADDWIISPSFQLEAGKKYMVSYDLRLLGTLFPANTAVWIGKEGKPEAMTKELASYEGEINDVEWIEHVVAVDVEESGSYNIGFHVTNLVPVQFYNFSIREVTTVDLAALELTGPITGAVGMSLPYRVTVKNLGFDTVEDFKVSLTDGEGNVVAESTVKESLVAGASTVVELTWTPENEGNFNISAHVSVDGDAIADNNTTAPIEVNIVGGGTWVDIIESNDESFRMPFDTAFAYSVGEYIYTADQINYSEGGSIKALNYYVNYYNGLTSSFLDVEVWLGNTDVADFDEAEPTPISLDNMTKVFDGTVCVNPGDKVLTIAFDNQFEYTGGNLVVYTCKKSALERGVFLSFFVNNNPEAPFRSIAVHSEQQNPQMVSLSDPMTAYHEFPDVSFLMGEDSSVDANLREGLNMPTVSYNRQVRQLVVNGDFSLCRVYNADGSLVATFRPGSEMVLPANAGGIGLVELTSPAGRTVRKIVF